jgi:hypothetical protein
MLYHFMLHNYEIKSYNLIAEDMKQFTAYVALRVTVLQFCSNGAATLKLDVRGHLHVRQGQ